MNSEQIEPIIEGILFAAGEPVSAERLALVLDTDAQTVKREMREIIERYNSRDAGLMIIILDDSYQLCTRSEYAQYIKRALDTKRKLSLSPAAMEVLSIIAYNQPVTRAYIEQVRGVDSSAVVTTLAEKGLVEENGKLDAPGRPNLYVTTKDFLRIFDISSLNELPELPLIQQTIQSVRDDIEIYSDIEEKVYV